MKQEAESLLLDSKDQNLIEELCFQLTGSRPDSRARLETCFVNLLRRIRFHGFNDLRSYLNFARESDDEIGELVSALTIHTTSWFRESPHFDRLIELARRHVEHERLTSNPTTFRVLSAACSSGEEAFSIGLVLESIREQTPSFDYCIDGWDIDPLSVEKAKRAVFERSALSQIPKSYQRFLKAGSGKTADLFTLIQSIRQRCHFQKQSIEMPPEVLDSKFHVIFCRNVLIYFKADRVDHIIQRLLKTLDPFGTLILGHSEGIEATPYALKSIGNTAYQFLPQSESKFTAPAREAPTKPNVRHILVIDDSPVAKLSLRRALEMKGCQAQFASSLAEASTLLRKQSFDLFLIDLSLISQDRNRWLLDQKRKGTLSSIVIMGNTSGTEAQSALGALEHGAQEFIDKRLVLSAPDSIVLSLLTLLNKKMEHPIQAHNVRKSRNSLDLRPPQLLLIGASTGGTEALLRLLKDIAKPCPPVLVVQHIASSFAKSFAERLAQVSGLQLGQPVSGSELKPNHLYMAWDDYHIGLRFRGGTLHLETSIAPPQHSVRPAVDFLFQSALIGKSPESIMAIVLTGMGKDGARGLLQLKNAGAMTLTQDEASSVVYGMPGEAVALGASSFSGTPEQLREQILQALGLTQSPPSANYS